MLQISKIGTAVALTREHLLVIGGETCIVTNALQQQQDIVVTTGPYLQNVATTQNKTYARAPDRGVFPGTFIKHTREPRNAARSQTSAF
jgi:hypothetical protein